LLLPTLYNRHLICYGRPGKKILWTKFVVSELAMQQLNL
jgi:hypothetical protein